MTVARDSAAGPVPRVSAGNSTPSSSFSNLPYLSAERLTEPCVPRPWPTTSLLFLAAVEPGCLEDLQSPAGEVVWSPSLLRSSSCKSSGPLSKDLPRKSDITQTAKVIAKKLTAAKAENVEMLSCTSKVSNSW